MFQVADNEAARTIVLRGLIQNNTSMDANPGKDWQAANPPTD